MYKITLYDCNCPSCTSGVAEFYADDIIQFKDSWFKLEDDKDRKERFLKSLNGEIVTDYYSDSPELNIVQEDKTAKILRTEKLSLKNQKFTLMNDYWCSGDILVLNAKFSIRYICFQGQYIIAGKYKLSGVASINNFSQGYDRQPVYGNRVLKTQYRSYVDFDKGIPLYDIRDINNFENDIIESICYIPIKYFDTYEDMQSYDLSHDDLIALMRDIIGEAG